MNKIKQKKTAHIHLMISPNHKKLLKEKAEELGLDLTEFIEKIAKERLIFFPKDIKATIVIE